MPIITIEMLTGRSLEQKKEMARVLTDELARIARCGPDEVFLVIRETEPHHFATGGVLKNARKMEQSSKD